MEFAERIEDMPDEAVNESQRRLFSLSLPRIRVLEYMGGEERVCYETSELIALCPMTGVPDFYRLKIEYVPDSLLPELKSLRKYLLAFKEVPALHEHLAQRIYRDFREAVKPKWLRITLEVAPRGGIITRVVVEDDV